MKSRTSWTEARSGLEIAQALPHSDYHQFFRRDHINPLPQETVFKKYILVNIHQGILLMSFFIPGMPERVR